MYKRQIYKFVSKAVWDAKDANGGMAAGAKYLDEGTLYVACLLYTSDAADERSSVDLGGRRIIKKKNIVKIERVTM